MIKNNLISLFLFLCIGIFNVFAQKDITETPFFRKDYTYIPEAESFYKIHRVYYNWWDAKKRCGAEGGTLWIPESELEVNKVLEMLKRKHEDVKSVHLGINDFASEGYFETVDGRRLDEVYSKWEIGEPNNLLFSEHCVQMKANGLMNDIFCYINQAFICKKTLSTLDWNGLCNLPDSEYIYNAATGKCYKLHKIANTWFEAKTICSVEESYLVIINNKKEAEVITEIISESYNRELNSSLIHLGFRNEDGHEWRTVQGNKLEDLDYTKWANSQPNYVNKKQNCGAMSFNGELHDINCNYRSPFICEHDVALLNNSIDERFG